MRWTTGIFDQKRDGETSEPTTPPRDRNLDALKGIAIVTVVLGHTFQNATPDFGNYLPFRIVYAFHMPMFMFVAGMAMSFGVLPAPGKTSGYVVNYVFKRAYRLLIPFFAWGLIQFVRVRSTDSLWSWFSLLLQAPDNGLWFLLALFEISVVIALCAWTARAILDRLDVPSDSVMTLIVLAGGLAVGSSAFWLLRYVFPSLGLAMFYIKYVCLGLVYRSAFPRGLHPAVGAVSLALFAALVPFWVWNGPPAIAWHSQFIDGRIMTAAFDFVVALSGTLATVEGARMCARHAPRIVVEATAYCGRRTLDIYAIHFFFVAGYFPPVIAPIALSLIVAFLLRQIPLASLVLFGDAKDRPLWWPAIAGLQQKRASARV